MHGSFYHTSCDELHRQLLGVLIGETKLRAANKEQRQTSLDAPLRRHTCTWCRLCSFGVPQKHWSCWPRSYDKVNTKFCHWIFFFLLMLNQNVSRESQIWGPWLESGEPWTGIKINVTISVFSMESCIFLAPNFTANLNKTKLNTICDQYFFG